MVNRTEQDIMKNWAAIAPPVVSVCSTTYNHENYISEAIDGFLMQETNFPFEIIIRDDCSTDKTASIVSAYAKKFPKIIKPIYETENQYSKGVKPMPEVFKKAVGKYFALCEGDDYWTDPLKLQKQVDFLEQNLEYVITYSKIQAFDVNGNIDKKYSGSCRDLEAIELQKSVPISTMTTCFRNVLKELPQEFLCARIGDLFTWSLLGHYGKGKYLENIKATRYRVHEGGIFSKQNKKHKLIMWQITSGQLYAYYDRIGNQELAGYFLERNLKASISVFGFSSLLKIIIKRVIKI